MSIRTIGLLALLVVSIAPLRASIADPSSSVHPPRRDLIGAWQLVSIQVVRADGTTADDDFYNAAPSGILVYDASGWMSVQIAGQRRQYLETPESRTGAPHSTDEAQTEAAVLDTYYAYAARWQYDPATAMVTHHVTSSLYPAEVGMDYSQRVSLDAGNLVLMVRREGPSGTILQRKIWRRLPASTADSR